MNPAELVTASPGVYLLTHRITGDTYIGSSGSLRHRLYAHARGRSGCKRLNTLIATHGNEFTVTILANTTEDERHQVETDYIAKLKPTLNMRKSAKARHNYRGNSYAVGIAARVDREVHDSIKELADADGRTVSYLVAKILREYVEKHSKPHVHPKPR